MNDIGEIIKGLENIYKYGVMSCDDCPYDCDDGIPCMVVNDAIIKLKKQEAELNEYHKADGFLSIHGWFGTDQPCPVLRDRNYMYYDECENK